KAQCGDNAAFSELIRQNTQGMYKVARSYLRSEDDIADAIQETILICFEKLTDLKRPRYFKTWLIRILINKCNDILKEQRRTCSVDVLPEIEDDSSQEDKVEFNVLINMLDDKYRVVLTLYYVEGFQIREIAELLSITENTVKTRLSRGRKKFALYYGQDNKRVVKEYEKKSDGFGIVQNFTGRY
ncbi:MAG: sigma-70 family RNA polymerase sigma factor, partial [Lachnospiraceae bacterium]|nr:sigma-70 family RNA polymerase sigma factor [Lachnospiraceae bacterium]